MGCCDIRKFGAQGNRSTPTPSRGRGFGSTRKLIPAHQTPRILPPSPHMLRGRDERSVRGGRVSWRSLQLLWWMDDP